MDISLEKNTATDGLIKIKLKEADYQSKYEEKVKSYSKQATFKGFRPGKVPPGLIRKMYGKSILVEEINKLLVDSLKQYIKDNDIKIIGDPLPNNEKASEIDWDNQKEFDFEYEVGLVDDFKYDLGFKITRFEIKAEKKDIEEIVKDLKKRYGKTEEIETSEQGDALFGELREDAGEFAKEIHIDSNLVKKKSIKLFTGLKVGDRVKVDIQSIFDKDEDLAALINQEEASVKKMKGEYEFEVKKIHRTIPAEMNQEFFDRIFGKDKVKSADEFMEKYTELIETNYKKESAYLLSKDMQQKMLDGIQLNVPEDFYRKWLLASNEGLREEDLKGDFEHYLRDLKWTLIKNRIADDNDIKVENEDVVKRTKEFFKEQYGMFDLDEETDKNLEMLANNYLQQNKGENYYNIYSQVRTEKIMDFVKQKAEITVKQVSRDEFNKKVEN